jgi:hypothetical protein
MPSEQVCFPLTFSAPILDCAMPTSTAFEREKVYNCSIWQFLYFPLH